MNNMKLLKFENGVIDSITTNNQVQFIKSWSNMYEDVILYELFEGKKEGFYIDIGANTPDFGSNTKLFYDLGWNGINVEPNPNLFIELSNSRLRDINLNYAVTDKTGEMVILYKLDTTSIKGRKDEGQSTIIPSVLEYRLNKTIPQENLEIYNLNDQEKNFFKILKENSFGKREVLGECQVATITLEEIFKMAGNREVDFVSIDVEGAEYLVIKGANLKLHRPKIIIIEDNKKILSKENENALDIIESSGYTLVCKDRIGLNKYYVRNEDLSSINKKLFKLNVVFLQMEKLFFDPIIANFDDVICCNSKGNNQITITNNDTSNKIVIINYSVEKGDKLLLKGFSTLPLVNLVDFVVDKDSIQILFFNSKKQILFYGYNNKENFYKSLKFETAN